MADFEVLQPGGHATLVAGMKDYARRVSQIPDQSITDEKLDPDGVISKVSDIETQLLDVSIDVDDLGLEQDEETGLVYPTYRGVRSENGIPLAGGSGGGGGGGGAGNNAVITLNNTTGWVSTSISTGAECPVSFEWSSLEDNLPTGDGTLMVIVGNVTKLQLTVSQGSMTLDVGPYLTTGTSKVKVRVLDTYDNSRTITFTISVVDLSIRSSFDTSATYAAGSTVDFTYTPVGASEKLVYFEVDGDVVDTETVLASGRQQTKTLPAMTHGAHLLRVWFTASVSGATVTSNVLAFSVLVVDPASNTPIVSTAWTRTTATQYETLLIPYVVYTPNSLLSQVTLRANGATVNSLTLDRTEHTWSYRCDGTGSLTLTITVGSVTKTLAMQVAASDIDVHAETDALALHLTSYGRSNAEAHPEEWADSTNNISATLTGFNFVSNGWVSDGDDNTVLRVNNGASVTVPYKPFAVDFRQTGKTIEVEFAVRDVLDYDAVVVSCMAEGRGFQLTSQFATLSSEQTTISTQYKEDEHVRVSIVAEKYNEDRLLQVYINGIASGAVQYPANDNFAQRVPTNITIGAAGATIDIYNVRVYDNDLTRYQVLTNWIADTQDVELMLERYQHNDVYDEYGNVVIEKLPSDLPYMVIECPQLPTYKGDKKTVSGYYVDPQNASKSFTFTGCQIDVQGTSSAPYYRKNWDLQFKGGFEMNDGTHASNYALAPGVIPFNRFVLKADVASSEGANNVELTMLYNDADPYKRPEQVQNPMVRKGIYGFPIVLFWHNTQTNETTFYGKANFNLPKRAAGPYGYSGNMESWEFQNNTSNLMLFLTDYFDETMVTDPTTGDSKEAWRYDYEARFPSDEWTNYAKLQELESFVYSTYRANATGNNLPQSVTYDGTTYAKDTAEYRLAKFRAEFGNYAELDSFIFYYVFTELFLMIDSRAKNLFIGFSGGEATGLTAIDRKAIAEPYDMDSAIGINNEGSLVFGYSLEDTDHVNNADVFNGQNSVLWCNIRDAFPAEITAMYQRMRSQGILSYATVKQRFEDHQAKWPEAIFNEDARTKYLTPLVNPDPGTEATDVYLPMLQGSKAEQRKWWLYNRFRYMDSKWLSGDALSQRIQLRGYAKADITVTPYSDIYPTIQYGSYYVSERGQHGVPVTLACPLDNVNDTEIYILSAPQLQSVGDLSGLKVGFADFASATKLTSIKVGSSASGYTNPNLTGLTVGSNNLLASVDARNCTNLAGSVNLSGAPNVEHVYLAGTAVTAVELPVGGILKTLQLPDTITNLTVRNQPNITSFTLSDTSNVTTLRVENCGDAIPVLSILEDMPEGSRVRVIGFTALVETTSDVEDFFDFLDTMKGMNESGLGTDTAVVSGTITGLGTITGAWLAEMRSRYPDVTIGYEHITSTLTYKSWDGASTLQTQTITDGGNGTYSGTPSRTSTAQYTFAFAGWSLEQDSLVADPDATKGVTYDRTVYAAYTATVRTYTVTWKNANNTTLETDTNVPYGTMPTYNGATPTYNGQTSTGWSPAIAPVTGNVTYTAAYVPIYTITWKSMNHLSTVENSLGTSQVQQGGDAVYSGATPTYDVQGFEFVGWDPEPTNVQGNTTTYAVFRDTRSPLIQYLEGTMESYESSTVTKMRKNAFGWNDVIKSITTSASRLEQNAIYTCGKLESVDLTNTVSVVVGAGSIAYNNRLTTVMIRSTSKAVGGSSGTITGPTQVKDGVIYVPSQLLDTYRSDSNWMYNLPIFASIDDYPLSELSDIKGSWSDVIASIDNGTFAAQLGDVKLLDLGSEGVAQMQLVGLDQDVLASDGTTKAKTSWIAYRFINTQRGFYDTSSTPSVSGGWESCGLRTWFASDMLPLIPSEVRSAIKEVRKYSGTYKNGALSADEMTSDKLWIPSLYEVMGTTTYETQGATYSGFFTQTNRRLRYSSVNRTSAYAWPLRTVLSGSTFAGISSSGMQSSMNTSSSMSIVFGFCI